MSSQLNCEPCEDFTVFIETSCGGGAAELKIPLSTTVAEFMSMLLTRTDEGWFSEPLFRVPKHLCIKRGARWRLTRESESPAYVGDYVCMNDSADLMDYRTPQNVPLASIFGKSADSGNLVLHPYDTIEEAFLSHLRRPIPYATSDQNTIAADAKVRKADATANRNQTLEKAWSCDSGDHANSFTLYVEAVTIDSSDPLDAFVRLVSSAAARDEEDGHAHVSLPLPAHRVSIHHAPAAPADALTVAAAYGRCDVVRLLMAALSPSGWRCPLTGRAYRFEAPDVEAVWRAAVGASVRHSTPAMLALLMSADAEGLLVGQLGLGLEAFLRLPFATVADRGLPCMLEVAVSAVLRRKDEEALVGEGWRRVARYCGELLHTICRLGHTQALEWVLVRFGARESDACPAHYARGEFKRTVDIHARSAEGWTPLQECARHNRLDAAVLLLAQEDAIVVDALQVDKRTMLQQGSGLREDGPSALTLARDKGFVEMVEAFNAVITHSSFF